MIEDLDEEFKRNKITEPSGNSCDKMAAINQKYEQPLSSRSEHVAYEQV